MDTMLVLRIIIFTVAFVCVTCLENSSTSTRGERQRHGAEGTNSRLPNNTPPTQSGYTRDVDNSSYQGTPFKNLQPKNFQAAPRQPKIFQTPSRYVNIPSQLRPVESHPNRHVTIPYFSMSSGAGSNYKFAPAAANSAEQIGPHRKPHKVQKYLPVANSVNQQTPQGVYGSTGYGVLPRINSATKDQVPVYKTIYPSGKGMEYVQMYAPIYQKSHDFVPTLYSPNKAPGNLASNAVTTPALIAEQITLPVLQPNQGVSAYLQDFEKKPMELLSSALQYKTQPVSNFNFHTGGFTGAPQMTSTTPFLSPVSSFQAQVVPIQTSSNNPQFPQYKGASIEVYPATTGLGRVPLTYEVLHAQPQLHFGPKAPSGPNSPQLNQAGEILNDVEIITANPPPPHTSPPDAEDDEDENDNKDKIRVHSEENQSQSYQRPAKYSHGAKFQTDFEPSKSFPFKAYDETFGKYSHPSNDEGFHESSKYKNYSSSEDDDDEGDEHSSSYNSDYTSSEPSDDSRERQEEEEEETQKQERREGSGDPDYEVPGKRYRHFGKDIDHEYEESYRKELPKNRYVHVKEVPDVEHNYGPKSSNGRRSERNKQDDHEQSSESSHYGHRPSYRNFKSSNNRYDDSESHSSNITPKKASKTIYEEYFGMKTAESQKHPKYVKHEGANKKSSHATETKIPQNEAKLKIEDSTYDKTGLYVYPAENNQKTSEASAPVLINVATGLDQPNEQIRLYHPTVVSTKVRSLTTAEVLRDLTGI